MELERKVTHQNHPWADGTEGIAPVGD